MSAWWQAYVSRFLKDVGRQYALLGVWVAVIATDFALEGDFRSAVDLSMLTLLCFVVWHYDRLVDRYKAQNDDLRGEMKAILGDCAALLPPGRWDTVRARAMDRAAARRQAHQTQRGA